MHVDLLIRNVRLATLSTKVDAPYGTIDEGLLAVKDGTIAWVGAASEAPRFDSKVELDGAKAWLTPGLIDCHTHLVFAGNRADEFEKRLQGVSYEQI
ncbi:MAG: imidazolonepropionase, partial [Gammaproteobacteria bacterium]|nr:imidazolonepropionase [Gammaproteobacteria bacterium]